MTVRNDPEAAPVVKKKLPLDVLKIHPDVQRKFQKRRSVHLIDNWNDDLAGELTVVPGPNGSGNYLVVDGQHRLSAMRHPEIAKREAWVAIHTDATSLPDQAKLQLGIGSVLQWREIDRFPLRVAAAEPEAVALQAILNRHGARVSEHTWLGYACIGTLETIRGWNDGPRILDRVVSVIEAAWPGSGMRQARSVGVVTALAYFWYSYPGAHHQRLAEKLREAPLSHMIRDARDRAYSENTGSGVQLAEMFRRRYNANLKNRLGPLNAPSRLRMPVGNQ